MCRLPKLASDGLVTLGLWFLLLARAWAQSSTARHPLEPVLARLDVARQALQRVKGYECQFIKRERIHGQLGPHEYMHLKIRHEPFSVYLRALGPERRRGDEAIYVEGANDGLVVAHTGGLRDRIAGTVRLEPTHPRLMRGNLYPITEIGIRNLVLKQIRLYEYEVQFAECDVKMYSNVSVDRRATDCIEVIHPRPRRNFRYYVARLFFDREWLVPIRFEGYGWPSQGAPPLVEEYTYTQIVWNPRLGTTDFDPKNPRYHFRD